MNERGMKKWRPFASLPEYKDYYAQMLADRKRVEMPLLSDDQKEEINNILLTACPGDFLAVKYFNDGQILKTKGVLVKTDSFSRILVLEGHVISFDNLISVSNS
jgi:hypothetical protein